MKDVPPLIFTAAMKTYRNIFFDLDDTLWDFSRNSREVYEKLFHKYGYDRWFDSFDRHYTLYKEGNDMLWDKYGKGEIDKAELNRLRFAYPFRLSGQDDGGTAERFCAESLEMMKHQPHAVEGAKELLAYLKDKGYRLFIISNGFRELQSAKLHAAGLDGFFSKVILSEDIMIHKPDKAIFHFALSATQSMPAQSVMIGDNFDTDITGARNAGIDQIFFNRKSIEKPSFTPTYTVGRLTEIEAIL